MGEKGLFILVNEVLIKVNKGIVLNPCEFCLFGKHHGFLFRSSARRKLDLLSLVYSDVCGPIEVESLGGSWYFETFIDDASRKVWVIC